MVTRSRARVLEDKINALEEELSKKRELVRAVVFRYITNTYGTDREEYGPEVEAILAAFREVDRTFKAQGAEADG